MNVGILSDGAFSAFQDDDWRTRFPILTNGAFTVFFVIIGGGIVFGIIDNNFSELTASLFGIITDKEKILQQHVGKVEQQHSEFVLITKEDGK